MVYGGFHSKFETNPGDGINIDLPAGNLASRKIHETPVMGAQNKR